MASLSEFAKRIRRRADSIVEEVDKTVVETAIAIDQIVVVETPVLNGFARGNWDVGINTPITDFDEGKADKDGNSTINRNNGKILTRQNGQTIYLSNPTPYIGRLNDGWSAQAPKGFVQQAVKTGAEYVARRRVVKDRI